MAKYECEICDFITDTKHNMNRHIASIKHQNNLIDELDNKDAIISSLKKEVKKKLNMISRLEFKLENSLLKCRLDSNQQLIQLEERLRKEYNHEKSTMRREIERLQDRYYNLVDKMSNKLYPINNIDSEEYSKEIYYDD
jgi:exonuclease VII large subunit